MNINFRKFRLSTYKEHEVTGSHPMPEFRYTNYMSGDNGGKQFNHVLKVGLTSLHFKWRSS